MENRVYIVLKDWVDYSVCHKQRIIDEFYVDNTTLETQVQNSKKLSPRKTIVNKQQNKLTLFV